MKLTVQGNDLSGSAATGPSSALQGDIFKVILDITNSTPTSWLGTGTAPTVANLMTFNQGGYSNSVGLVDGFTMYAIAIQTNRFMFYPNPTAAYTQTLVEVARWSGSGGGR